jgi:cyanophycinase
MSGVLALVGGGEWTDGCTFDRGLLEASGGTEVVILPAAAAYENPAKKIALAEGWFGSLGAQVQVLDVYGRSDALDEDAARQARAATFLYLCEGGSMHLRSVLKDTPVYDAMVDAWHGGAVLAGSGAGGDVLCDPMVDARGGAYTVGLGLMTALSMIPRYNTWSHDKVHRTVQLAPAGSTVVGVPESTALIRDTEGNWRVEGVGEVDVWIDHKPSTVDDIAH